MQTVGRLCGSCKQRIVVAHEALGCAPCDDVFHIACIESNRCRNCGEDLLQQATDLEGEERSATDETLRFGRLLFWAGAGLYLSLLAFRGALVLVLEGLAEPSDSIGAPPFRFVIAVVLLLCTLYGHFWARLLLGIQLIVAFSVHLGAGLLAEFAFETFFINGAFAFLYGICFVLLCLQPSVSFYLQAQRNRSRAER